MKDMARLTEIASDHYLISIYGIVRCCFAGEHSDWIARCAHSIRGTVPEARTEGL
jgi:hypothetical protein